METIPELNNEMRALLRMANRMAVRFAIRGQAEAEDIAQDAMLKVLARKSTLPPTSGWMYKTVRSVGFDARRRLAAQSQYLRRADIDLARCGLDDEEENGYGLGVLQARVSEVPREDVGSRVASMLQQLAPALRQALVLSAFGYSYKEMAEMTGANIGTVRSRVHYARKQARSLLADLR